MKFQIVLVACLIGVAVAGLSKEQKEAADKLVGECAAEAGTTVEDVKEARKGNIKDEAKQTKYLLCVFKRLHFVKEDGSFDVEKVKAKIPADADRKQAEAVIDECLAVKGDTLDARILASFKCYVEKKAFNLL